jgi:dihydrofolate synthase/folylpolyglutamate synthase
MSLALDVLGHPENAYPHVLVAGTNGKGSTCVYLEKILQNAGWSVGTTLSPHLSRFTERFRVNGTEADAGELEMIRGGLEPVLAPVGLTYFEWCVVLAAVLFKRRKVDAGIFEVGLGGRYDASNALDPGLALITEISLDHTDYLGGTIAEIAGEKARIARPGKPVMITADAEALQVIGDYAHAIGAELHVVRGTSGLPVSLEGRPQKLNAALALEAARMMGARPDDACIEHALRTSYLPGRIELFGDRVVMDVAHNASSVLVLVEYLKSRGFDGVGVVGILADKDCLAMVSTLRQACSLLYIAPVRSPRSWGIQEMKRAEALGGVVICESITRAFSEALQTGRAVTVTGSFHTVSEVRESLICRGWPS